MDSISFYKFLPKIELHAHLSGSISHGFLDSLSNEKKSETFTIKENDDQSFEQGFSTFKRIHDLIQNALILKKATTAVVEDFAGDGVVYLELRTTVKLLPTLDSYVGAVIDGIKEAPSFLNGRILVALLFSIDRSKGINEAFSAVELAHKYATSETGVKIVGIDLSGNPSMGKLCDFVPALELARSYGLKTTVHMAELPNESVDCLRFLQQHTPDRIGHGTFFTCGETDPIMKEVKQIVEEARIPLELCLSSNVKTKSVKSYSDHHLKDWLVNDHPVSICTDDKGIFSCSNSGELELAVKHCGLSEQQWLNILTASIQSAFCSKEAKHNLLEQLEAYYATLPSGSVEFPEKHPYNKLN